MLVHAETDCPVLPAVIPSPSGLPEGVFQAKSLAEAMSLLASDSTPPIHHTFIIGGAQLYTASLASENAHLADRILLTRIAKGDEQWSCDTFFPELDESQWRKAGIEEHRQWLEGVEVPDGEVTEGEIAWRYEMWCRT